MPGHAPEVTVIIPVYNSVATLQRAVRSVQQQSLQNLELIIVDDSSKDQSLALAVGLAEADSRIRIIALPENRGKPHAMNRAIAGAAGAWVAVLDADDWYEPDRLALLIAAGEHHNVQLVADNQFFHDAGAGQLIQTAFPTDGGDRPLTRATFVAEGDPYATFNYGMLKPVIRADFIRNSALSYRENARISEDFLYIVEFLAANGVGYVLAQPLYNWTQSFGSISRQWTTTGAGAWRYDFQSALDPNSQVLAVLREKHEYELAALLLARQKAFRNLHHMTELSRSRSSGTPLPKLLTMAARHPSVWPLLTRRALRAVRVIKRI